GETKTGEPIFNNLKDKYNFTKLVCNDLTETHTLTKQDKIGEYGNNLFYIPMQNDKPTEELQSNQQQMSMINALPPKHQKHYRIALLQFEKDQRHSLATFQKQQEQSLKEFKEQQQQALIAFKQNQKQSVTNFQQNFYQHYLRQNYVQTPFELAQPQQQQQQQIQQQEFYRQHQNTMFFGNNNNNNNSNQNTD